MSLALTLFWYALPCFDQQSGAYALTTKYIDLHEHHLPSKGIAIPIINQEDQQCTANATSYFRLMQ